MKVLIQHSLLVNEENHEQPQSSWKWSSDTSWVSHEYKTRVIPLH